MLLIFESNPEVDLIVLDLRDLISKFPADVLLGESGGSSIIVDQDNSLSSLGRMVDLLDVSTIEVEMSFNFRVTVCLQSENGIGGLSSSRISSHFVSSVNDLSIDIIKVLLNSSGNVGLIRDESSDFSIMISLQSSLGILQLLDLSLQVSNLLSVSIKQRFGFLRNGGVFVGTSGEESINVDNVLKEAPLGIG